MIETAENFMQYLGFSQLRIRMHGKIAQIELIPEEFERAVNFRHKIVEAMEGFDFSYIARDLKEYISGSMGEVL